MPIVPAKCPNCAANLEVNNSQDAAICTYCGTPFIVEKAINNYQISNRITANVVNVYGNANSDFEIVAGVLKSYRGSSASVVIPNNVSVIGGGAFSNLSTITSVTIPNSVVSIENCAFDKCYGLRNIKLPNTVKKIGDYAFYRSGLVSIDIPSSVGYLGECAFGECTSLQSARIGAATVGRSAFWNLGSLNEVEFLNSVQEIDSEAFGNCYNLKNVTLPESLKYIHCMAFHYDKSLIIKWPMSYNKKEVSKFTTALLAQDIGCDRVLELIGNTWRLGYKPNYKAAAIPFFYKEKKNDHQGNCSLEFSLDSISDRVSQKLTWDDFMTIEDYQKLKDLSRNSSVYYKELSDFLRKAGIGRDAVKVITIPLYYTTIFGRAKQTGAIELIRMHLSEA